MQLANLGQSAQLVLASFLEQFALIEGFDMPPGAYVGAGNIPWDGEGVYVYLGSTGSGQPGKPQGTTIPTATIMVQFVTLYIQIVRRVSTFGFFTSGAPQPASDEQLNADGVVAMDDVSALLTAALAIRKAGTLTNSQQAGFVIGPVTAIGPEGGFAAMRLQLDLQLDS